MSRSSRLQQMAFAPSGHRLHRTAAMPRSSICTAAGMCSLDSHRHLVAEAGRAAGCWALALDYRLAPEHPFPAPVEDSVAGYRYLLARGVKPSRIAVGGDSAGGGLVVAAMVAIRD